LSVSKWWSRPRAALALNLRGTPTAQATRPSCGCALRPSGCRSERAMPCPDEDAAAPTARADQHGCGTRNCAIPLACRQKCAMVGGCVVCARASERASERGVCALSTWTQRAPKPSLVYTWIGYMAFAEFGNPLPIHQSGVFVPTTTPADRKASDSVVLATLYYAPPLKRKDNNKTGFSLPFPPHHIISHTPSLVQSRARTSSAHSSAHYTRSRSVP